MAERSQDWYKQACRDIKSARSQRRAHFYEWACFIAQQASEKAVKAVYQKLAAEAWGHSVNDLVKGLSRKANVPKSLLEQAARLDKFYIPARYPNGWASGFPGQYLSEKDAKDAISDSEKIIRFCGGLLAK